MGKNDYNIPQGRLAQVQAIQNYHKHYTPLLSHIIKQGGKNARYLKKNEYYIHETEYPLVHHSCPKLLRGKVKMNYKQADIFDIDKRPPKKLPKPKFYYRDEFTGKWN